MAMNPFWRVGMYNGGSMAPPVSLVVAGTNLVLSQIMRNPPKWLVVLSVFRLCTPRLPSKTEAPI